MWLNWNCQNYISPRSRYRYDMGVDLVYVHKKWAYINNPSTIGIFFYQIIVHFVCFEPDKKKGNIFTFNKNI